MRTAALEDEVASREIDVADERQEAQDVAAEWTLASTASTAAVADSKGASYHEAATGWETSLFSLCRPNATVLSPSQDSAHATRSR